MSLKQRPCVPATMRRVLLVVEFVTLFVGLPLFFFIEPVPLPKMPFLLAGFVYCVVVLARKKRYEKGILCGSRSLRSLALGIAVRAIVATAALWWYVKMTHPEWLLAFPRQNPVMWGVVMCLYPVLSAFPQEFIYRTFLFERYETLFPDIRMQVACSTLAFSFLHLAYDNFFAVISTLLAGLILSLQYARTGSLLAVTVEHSLYGCIVFTVGLGRYFFEGW